MSNYKEQLPNLITTTDLADELGVDVSTVVNWQRRTDTFPKAVLVTGKTRFFDRDTAVAWAIEHYAEQIKRSDNATVALKEKLIASEYNKAKWVERLDAAWALQKRQQDSPPEDLSYPDPCDQGCGVYEFRLDCCNEFRWNCEVGHLYDSNGEITVSGCTLCQEAADAEVEVRERGTNYG